MRLTKRKFSILTILNDNPQITMKSLSQKIDVTFSTLKKELAEMQELFNEYDIQTDANGKENIIVSGAGNLSALVNDAEKMIEFSVHDQIIMYLFLHNDYVVMQDIADALFVSKSLVEKQTTRILKEFGSKLESIRHNGIRFNGSEAERREYFSSMINQYLTGESYVEDMRRFHKLHFPILDYITESDIEDVMRVIDFIQKIAPFSFTDKSVNLLFSYMIIQKYCIDHKFKAIENVFARLMMDVPEKIQFDGVAELADSHFNLKFGEDEREYLSYILMILRKRKNINNEMAIMQTRDLIEAIYKRIKDELFIDFSDDRDFTEGLSLHIYSTVLRKNFTDNTIIDYQIREIRKIYPLGYEMATITAEVIKEFYDYIISEVEISYLVFHFQAAVERMKEREDKLKILVVCQYGAAAANLVSAKVSRRFNQIEILGTMSRYEFLSQKDRLNNVDLILSTDKLESNNIPVIRVSPALNEEQMRLIQNMILQHSVMKELLVYLAESEVMIDDCSSRKEVINKIIDYMEKEDIADSRYRKTVLEREKISSTCDGYIAIPHGDPAYIKRSKLVVMKLNNKVCWDGENYAEYVFLFAFSKQLIEKNNKIFSTFYRGLANPALQMRLEEADTDNIHTIKQIIINTMSEGGQYD